MSMTYGIKRVLEPQHVLPTLELSDQLHDAVKYIHGTYQEAELPEQMCIRDSPIAIREALEERGIVNGQVADPEKLDNSSFIQQVMSDVEQIAAVETEQTSKVAISDEEYDAVRRPIPQRTSYDPAAPVYACLLYTSRCV